MDPTKLVSQFLVRKTPVQVRRRILQCCRPGFPDNVVKVTGEQRVPVGLFWSVPDPACLQAYRYQRVLWPMAVACRHVHSAQQRPPVEREERVLPLWLAVCDVITSFWSHDLSLGKRDTCPCLCPTEESARASFHRHTLQRSLRVHPRDSPPPQVSWRPSRSHLHHTLHLQTLQLPPRDQIPCTPPQKPGLEANGLCASAAACQSQL